MKKWLILLFVWLPTVLAAKVPVEEEILKQISDPASPYYYPNLMMRYRSDDLTLTPEEYHYLYYGFAYQENYRPLEPNDAFDKLMLMASTLDIDRPEVATLEKILVESEKALQRDPFSPQILNLEAYAYGALGNTKKEQAAFEKMRMVMMTIEDSGTGQTKEDPCHILMFDHALSLLASYGLSHDRARIISREVEYIPLTTPRTIIDKKIKGYYFDYSRIYRNKPEGYTFKRDRTWQFNNLPPKEYK